MKMPRIGITCFTLTAAAVALMAPATPANANFLEGLGEGMGQAGGEKIIECMFGGCQQQQPKTRGTPRAQAQPWSAKRQQRAAVQSALNDFGFPVGSADGVYGRNTSNGMRQYQSSMGYPMTGNLNPFEEQTLLRAHQSFTSGMHNSAYPGLFQREGMQGLLRAHADPNYYASNYGNGSNQNQGGFAGNQGNAGNGWNQGNFGNNGNVGNNGNFGNNGNGQLVNHDGNGSILRDNNQGNNGFALGDGGLAPLVPLEQIGEVASSMQDHCDITKLSTQTNGGQILATSMTNPDQALSEHFCDARTYLMSNVANILSSARATEEQLVQSCKSIATEMKPVMSSISSKGPEVANAEANGIVGSLGLSDPAAAAQYGEVCIGLGYRGNDSDMAFAGALMLTSAGRAPFAEMVGHHVRNGFGTAVNRKAANAWYQMGLDALASNQPPAVLPSQTIQRSAIIRAAVDAESNQAQVNTQPSVVPVTKQLIVPLE